jgi:hypothetical protein
MIRIQPVEKERHYSEFIDFVYDLYEGDPCFVPELYIAQMDLMNPKKNPFFDNAKAQLFLAKKGNQVVGRIAAVKDDNLIGFTGEAVGVFGFFDVIEDYEVASLLLDTAVHWIKQEGLQILEGPYNFSINHTCGTLIEGFDEPPTVMMTYNKPYYQTFLERYGLQKKVDLLSYKLDSNYFPERLQLAERIIEKRMAEKGITVRPISLKHFERDVLATNEVYNHAWRDNLGYTPMSEKEFLHAAKDMKLIIEPGLVMLAEHKGKVIGFALSLPDINEVLIKIKRGRLFPFGIFTLLFNKKKIQTVRVIALGILEEYRRVGIDAYFYIKAFQFVRNHPVFCKGEASWILENNLEMNQALIKMNGLVNKRYRLYRKEL